MAPYSTPIPGVPQYGQAALAAKTAYGTTGARTQGDVSPYESNDNSVMSGTTGITVGTATDSLDAPAYMVLAYIIKE